MIVFTIGGDMREIDELDQICAANGLITLMLAEAGAEINRKCDHPPERSPNFLKYLSPVFNNLHA